jgi:hypothetical protein
MDEPKLDLAIKSKDIDPMRNKASEIVGDSRDVKDTLQRMMNEEDNYASYFISDSKKYYYISVIQILFVISLGIYQVISFRKYLNSNYLI